LQFLLSAHQRNRTSKICEGNHTRLIPFTWLAEGSDSWQIYRMSFSAPTRQQWLLTQDIKPYYNRCFHLPVTWMKHRAASLIFSDIVWLRTYFYLGSSIAFVMHPVSD
jgi:hypothetical protein